MSIPRRLKTCNRCHKLSYLFSKGRCKGCATKEDTKPIKKVSVKHQKALREYSKEKAVFLETIEHCQFPDCEVTTVELHHMAGRIGSLLSDKSNFKALCHTHHQWAELNPNEAKELGLSLDRLN